MRIFFLLSFLLLSFSAHAGEGFTLKECYRMALKRSETIAIQAELIKETEGVILQSLSTALPKVSFSYTQKWQDERGSQHGREYDPEAKFTLTQPLFTGFKEFAAIAASKHVGRQRKAELKRAEQLLFVDVADAFYLYWSFQQDEEALGGIRKALADRLSELEKRERIGKSRLAEVASADAKLRKTEAGLENVRAQKEAAGELLAFLTGRSVQRLVAETVPSWKVKVDQLLKGVDQRPDIVAAREEAGSFRENVRSARSAFLPSVSLGANAYTKRPDANEGNDWDALLTFQIPIFNGTTDIGAYDQARARKNAADLRLERSRRMAEMEIKSAYVRWQANIRRVKAQGRSVKASQRNYDLQLKDFQNNLVNSLDILTAIEDLQTARRELVTAETDLYRSFWSLKVSAGENVP